MDKTLNNLLNKTKEIFDTVRQKPMLVYGIGCLLLTVLSFFFTYYLRVIYSPAWLGQINGTLYISVAFVVLWTVFVLAARFKDKNQPLFMTGVQSLFSVTAAHQMPQYFPEENSPFQAADIFPVSMWQAAVL